MIICSKDEGNGTFREFALDNAAFGDKAAVKTHLAHRTDEGFVADDEWRDAGMIKRADGGVEASILRSVRRGRMSDFVKLDKVFPNEVAALQAIAKHYVASTTLNN
ncbi:MAG: hypothetical protein ABL996_20605 [Micropepsaceae bacterium]|jgi:hypothetical protein